ncbi:hypothetical protein FJT64_027720 [Amphibalanus amphitrite]|uniref:Uncharacterized protein n=1 Tax=Amphibalanus amphitrite TaxID=1232801 RepID=A0A6A4VXG8_AMPAM|nr:hypothetical protein FJT64_027720 [Amphibalanus amphitrite]
MYRVVLWEQVRLTEHLRALETVFGYVLHGRDDVPVCQPMKYALRCSRLQTQDFRPEQLWSLETLGITAEEEKAGPSAIPRWSDADQSVPRLELMAALIGCRLMDFVIRSLDLSNPRVVYWTDAMDVLYWLDQRRALKVFVRNRVTSILQLTSRDNWRSASAGPQPALAAVGADLLLSTEAAVELKPEEVQTRVRLIASQGEKVPFDVTACSHLSQAVDRLAWMRRFISNCRLQRTERMTGPLTPEERMVKSATLSVLQLDE